jgi:hypothetical protein
MAQLNKSPVNKEKNPTPRPRPTPFCSPSAHATPIALHPHPPPRSTCARTQPSPPCSPASSPCPRPQAPSQAGHEAIRPRSPSSGRPPPPLARCPSPACEGGATYYVAAGSTGALPLHFFDLIFNPIDVEASTQFVLVFC